MVKIKIDPGHGAHDPGALGSRTSEKDVVLKLSKMIVEELKRYSGVVVTMTRDSDVFIPLSQRAKLANDWGADCFVSVHCNSFNKVAHGYETYKFLRTPGSTDRLADAVHSEVMAFNSQHGITDRKVQRKDLAVLRETNMDAILTENLFIDNASEENLLLDDNYLRGVAKSHAKGIAKFYGLKYNGDTGTAQAPQSGEQFARVLVNDLWVYGSPNWDDKVQKVQKGEAFKILDTVTVNGSKMYKCQYFYITAWSEYVQVISK